MPALLEYRAVTAKRRAIAFCDAPEFVLGTEVLPLTPATFSMLYAMGSAFVMGGAAQEFDVRNYLWFHSRLYAHCGIPDWRKRKREALRRLSFELNQPWRKWVGLKPSVHRYTAVLAIAVSEIKQLVEEAFADSPAKSGRPGKPVATLEAFFIHEFAMAYRWGPEQTRHFPLRQLIQLHRCIRAGRGEDPSDDGEDRIYYEHLRARNEALAAQRNGASR